MFIELPWPLIGLSPNWTGRLQRKLHAKKAYKSSCFYATRGAIGRGLPFPDGPIPVTITFCPPDKRKRDRDNMIGSFKHGQDGLAMALGVDDARFVPTYLVGEVIKGGSVVVQIGPSLQRRVS